MAQKYSLYKKYYFSIIIIFFFSINITYAQLCEGSLGYPVVEINFGSGVGRGSALGSSITAFTYVASGVLDEGQYTITSSTSGLRGDDWHVTSDHTGNTNGYMMVINSAVLANEGVFYTKTVPGLCANTTYEFSAWVMNVLNPSRQTDRYKPNVTFRISDTSGNILGFYNTGEISQTTSATWLQYGFYFTLDSDTEVVITMLNSAASAIPGNDIALDDISFRPCGPTITNSIDGNSTSISNVCQDETVNISLEANLSSGYSDPRYQWQQSINNGVSWVDLIGETSQNFSFTNSSSPGIFKYRVAIANGDNINSLSCRIISDEFTVEVIEKPAPLVGDTQQSFCSTQNATLSDIEINETAVWYDTLAKNNILPETTNLVDGTTYYATNIKNGCESDEVLAVLVTIYDPSLEINDVEAFVCDNLNDSREVVDLTLYQTDITSCLDCSFSYFLSQSDAQNYNTSGIITSPNSYNWTSGNSSIYVRIDSPDKCYQIARINLNLEESPTIPISNSVSFCENDNTITIDAGLGFDSYLWSTNETSQTIIISNENVGAYWVTVTQGHGNYICSSTKEFQVTLSNKAVVANIEVEDWTNSDNSITIFLSDTSLGNYEYSVDSTTYQDNNIFTGLSSGEHTVYIRDKNGCGITEEQVYILNYPKFFTPNNDGFHDTWSIKYSETERNLNIRIFDRYGKFLKSLTSNSSWDGTLNGYNLPTSDYWFVVTRQNGIIYKGHSTLKR